MAARRGTGHSSDVFHTEVVAFVQAVTGYSDYRPPHSTFNVIFRNASVIEVDVFAAAILRDTG